MQRTPVVLSPTLACASLALLLASAPVRAQGVPPAQAGAGWQACAALGGADERLACFDRWAAGQAPAPPAAASQPAPPDPAPAAASALAAPAAAAAAVPEVVTGPWRNLRLTSLQGCRDRNYSELSRFWELEPGADCGTFGLRGYRPTTLALVAADTVNRQPTSLNPLNNATTSTDYRSTEVRLQLSVRTKIAQGLLPPLARDGSDSLWLAYTQQSYWQLFTPQLSRPFRTTDHEPELVYVLPLQSAQEGRWRLRFAGIGAVHQSNGQSLPYSRSWNRAYLMAGAERGPLQLNARVWRRMEAEQQDDNPGITSYIGRAELRGSWQVNRDHLLAATVRHTLRKPHRGSLRLEWFRTLGADSPLLANSGLQLHTQLFSGYGDSLLDYNRRRTVLSVGLSLVDW